MTSEQFSKKLDEWKSKHIQDHAEKSQREIALIEWFNKLKIAHDWIKTETSLNQIDKGLARVEEIYNELEKLRVDKLFSTALFVFGDVVIDGELLSQFV